MKTKKKDDPKAEWLFESAPYWGGGAGAMWEPSTATTTISVSGTTTSWPTGTWSGSAIGSGWGGGLPLTASWGASGTFTLSWDEFDGLTKEQRQMVRDLICDEVLARA